MWTRLASPRLTKPRSILSPAIFFDRHIRFWAYYAMHSTLAALAEPNRFRIVELLRAGPLHVGEIERTLELQQPQVSKHLRVLREAGLVVAAVDAQRRRYELQPQPFQELDEWLERYRTSWNVRLDDLEAHLDNSRTGRPE